MLQYTLLGMGEPCEIDSVSTEGISSGDIMIYIYI